MPNETAKFIKIKTSDGEILELAIQQYVVGLYVCFYKNGNMVGQTGINTTAEKFIQSLKDDDKIEVMAV